MYSIARVGSSVGANDMGRQRDALRVNSHLFDQFTSATSSRETVKVAENLSWSLLLLLMSNIMSCVTRGAMYVVRLGIAI